MMSRQGGVALRQRGGGLVGMLAVLFGLAATTAAFYVAQSSGTTLASASAQRSALRVADKLLQAFIEQHGRLPCASATVNGPEACGIQGIGYLPTAALLPASSSLPQLPPIKYLPFQGTSGGAPDLTAATDSYSPLEEATGGSIKSYQLTNVSSAQLTGPVFGYPTIISNPDFCSKLHVLYPMSSSPWGTASNIGKSPVAGQAYVASTSLAYPSATVPSQNVIYAVAVSGGANGYGSASFSGLNAAPGYGIDSPLQPLAANYGDQVVVRTAADISRRMQCETLVSSVDVLAGGVGFADDVQSEQQGDVQGYNDAITILEIVVAFDGYYDSLRLAQLAITTQQNADAIANIALDTLALDFPQVALDVAGQAAEGLALGNAAAQTGSTIADSLYLAQYQALEQATAASNVWNGGAQSVLAVADRYGMAFPILSP